MSIGNAIFKLRSDYNLSQEKFAELIGVTRQSVQKWESNSVQPDIQKLITIAKFFNVSLDSMILGSDKRIAEELSYDKKIQPEYDKIHDWEAYSSQLWIEHKQSLEEGKDIAAYDDLFKSVSKMPKSEYKEKISDIIFNIVLNSPQKQDYGYNEPSDLEHIKLLRPSFNYKSLKLDQEVLEKKVHGAWMGRVCGCLLGKPVEGMRTHELHPFLKESNNFPMHRYIKSTDITEEVCHKYKHRLKGGCYPDTISCAPIDDDTNYTVLAQILIDKYKRDFTPYDVSRVWMDYQAKNAYCTAERVAFRNFVNGFVPPFSAIYKNPYREWIGAQIRGDYFGYINPGNAELAAEMAWRDASISHVKNGIYGEMFVAAMIACAAVNNNSIEDLIYGGLSQIPFTSRLYHEIDKVVKNFKSGLSEKDCFSGIHKAYDENDEHNWCHTISNAIIVAASLLYGNDDFGKSICLAVQTGFDTDCNGATVGSILGMRNGIDSISAEWTKPINGKLETSIFGVGTVSIDDLCSLTLKHTELIS